MPSGAAGQGGKPVATAGGGGGGGELVDETAGAGGAPVDQPAAAPCDRSGWQLKAFASAQVPTPSPPELAVDGVAATRWSSGEERKAGQWLELELSDAQTVEALELRTPAYPGDVPSSLIVKLDGKATPATFDTKTEGVLRVAFAAREVRAVRLELDAGAPSWWSVSELVGVCR